MNIREYQSRDEQDVIDFYLSLGYTDNKIIGLGKRLEGDEPYQGRDR